MRVRTRVNNQGGDSVRLDSVAPLEPLAVREEEGRRMVGGGHPVSRATWWEWWKSGEIESFTVGRCRFFVVDSIKQFVERQTATERARLTLDGPSAA